jgi:hypothetical protein
VRRRGPEEGSLEAELRSSCIAPASPFASEELAELRQRSSAQAAALPLEEPGPRPGRKEPVCRSPEVEKEITFAAEEPRGRKEPARSPDTWYGGGLPTSEELRLSRKEVGRNPEISFALGEQALYALARVPAPRELLTDLEDWERLSVLEAAQPPARPEKEVVRRRGPPPGPPSPPLSLHVLLQNRLLGGSATVRAGAGLPAPAPAPLHHAGRGGLGLLPRDL